MFELHYYDNNFFGIRIKKNEINLGDKDLFNKLKSIKLDEQLEDYWIISFAKEISKDEIILFRDMFNIDLGKEKSLSNIINKYIELFKKFEVDKLINEYIGLLTELAFLYICKKNNIDLIKFYQVKNDKFDLNVNNHYLEIKHINELDKTILISSSQLAKLNPYDYIIGIRLVSDTNGIDLKGLIKKIDFNDKQLEYICKRAEKLNDVNIRINVDQTLIHLIEKKYVPKIDEDPRNLIASAQYKLFSLAMNKDNKEALEILEEIL